MLRSSNWHNHTRLKIFIGGILCVFLCACLALLSEGWLKGLFGFDGNYQAHLSKSAHTDEKPAQSFFGSHAGGKVFTIRDLDETRDETKGDYLAFVWFNLTRSLDAGERALLLSRNRVDNGRRTSFSIALQGSVEGIRPLVSFGNPARTGEWIPFTEVPLRPEKWYAFVISCVESKFISVQVISEGEESAPILLGAHRISAEDEKLHKATLTVGLVGVERFGGLIGPFGVLRGSDIRKHTQDCIDAIKEPEKGPPQSLLPAVLLWATPYDDLSPYHREIIIKEESLPARRVVKTHDHKRSKKRVREETNAVKKIASLRKHSKKKLKKEKKN